VTQGDFDHSKSKRAPDGARLVGVILDLCLLVLEFYSNQFFQLEITMNKSMYISSTERIGIISSKIQPAKYP